MPAQSDVCFGQRQVSDTTLAMSHTATAMSHTATAMSHTATAMSHTASDSSNVPHSNNSDPHSTSVSHTATAVSHTATAMSHTATATDEDDPWRGRVPGDQVCVSVCVCGGGGVWGVVWRDSREWLGEKECQWTDCQGAGGLQPVGSAASGIQLCTIIRRDRLHVCQFTGKWVDWPICMTYQSA